MRMKMDTIGSYKTNKINEETE